MAKKQRKIQLEKFKMPKLTEEERTLIAQNLDSPFVKLLATKIIPGRAQQLALTCVSAAQNEQDLWFYKGRVAEADWLPHYLNTIVEGNDDAEYNTNTDEDGEIDAKDDSPDT
jgi:hypothetical protein